MLVIEKMEAVNISSDCVQLHVLSCRCRQQIPADHLWGVVQLLRLSVHSQTGAVHVTVIFLLQNLLIDDSTLMTSSPHCQMMLQMFGLIRGLLLIWKE